MNLHLRRTHAAVLTATALITVLSAPAWAQQAVPSPTATGAVASDPPGRVARLNYFAGNVTMQPAGETAWSYAQPNRPLTTGDQVWTDNGARAELHVGSTALRLNQQTALSMVDIDDTTLQLKVTQGSLSAHVRALPPGQTIEVDTPNVAMQATSAAEFRVDVAPDGNSTTVTLRSGNATLYGDGGSLQMSAGQQIRFTGVNLQQQAGGPAPGLDAFDQWIVSRDRLEDASVSARYVSREIPGYEDLDANGTWRADPSYGEVWVPTVAVSANWAPYREGHWTWIAPWGWTWVDDAPWGFAPFHYGRWAYLGNAWAWVPGPVVAVRPVYAPALVAFVGGGGGSHWGVDLAIGGAVGAGVAWFALGPHEPWHPGSGYSPSYYNRVNNTVNVHNTTIVNNITNVHNTYINQRVPGAIVAVPAATFVHGQPVAQAAHGLTPEQIGRAQIGAGTPGIAPVRGSFTGGMRVAQAGVPPQVAQRQVVATRAPAVPAAYRDTLAQRFASGGGHVEGAGEPIVRTTVPAAFSRPINGNAPAATEGYRLVSRAASRPVTPQGAPARNVGQNVSREEGHNPQTAQPVQPHAPVAAQSNTPRPFVDNAGHNPAEHNPAEHAPRPEQQNEAQGARQAREQAPGEPRPEPKSEPRPEHEVPHAHPPEAHLPEAQVAHATQPVQHAESHPQPARPPEHEQHQEHQEHHEEHAK